METGIKQAIRDHAAVLRRTIGPRDDLATVAMRLARFINEAYKLNYADGSDSHGCLFKACYDAVWEMTRP